MYTNIKMLKYDRLPHDLLTSEGKEKNKIITGRNRAWIGAVKQKSTALI